MQNCCDSENPVKNSRALQKPVVLKEKEKQNKSKIVKGHSFKSKTTNQIIKLPVFKLWSIHVRRGVDDPGRQTEILN